MTCRRRNGMTLIEILVSVAISTILVMAAYSVYAAATAGWDTSRRRTDMHQRARLSLDLISRCIRAAAVSNDPDVFIFEGENVEVEPAEDEVDDSAVFPAQDLLALRTNAPLYLPGDEEAPDQTRVQFFLEAPVPDAEDAAEQPLSLKMKVDANFEPDTSESGWFIDISEEIEQLNFRYFNGSAWEDSWTSTSGVPRAVEVTLVVMDIEGQERPQTFSRICPVAGWRELDLQPAATPTQENSQQQTQRDASQGRQEEQGGSRQPGRGSNQSQDGVNAEDGSAR